MVSRTAERYGSTPAAARPPNRPRSGAGVGWPRGAALAVAARAAPAATQRNLRLILPVSMFMAWNSLEQDLKPKLELPRRVRLRADHTEAGRCHACRRTTELDPVEGVEELRPELHANVLAREELLKEREIRAVLIRCAQIADVRAYVPKRERRRLAEYAGVEVLVEAVMHVPRQHRRLSIAVGPLGCGANPGDIAGADGQRRSTLNRGDSIDLPSAQHPVHRARRVSAELPAMAEGKLVDITHHETMRDVGAGDSPVRPVIVAVLMAAALRVEHLRPGIGAFELETVGKALGKTGLQALEIRDSPARVDGIHVGELWVGAQHLHPAHLCGGQNAAVDVSVKRIGYEVVEVRPEAEINRIDLVEIESGLLVALQLEPAVAHIADLHRDLSRQCPLYVQVPLDGIGSDSIRERPLDDAAGAGQQTL